MHTSIKSHYDVIVAGGGSAGVAAAIAAARSGADTLVVESNGYFGGTITAGALPTFAPYTDQKKPVIQGIGLEIMDKLREITWRDPLYESRGRHKPRMDWFPIDTEAMKLLFDRLVVESGCQPLFYTRVIGCQTEGGTVKSVTLLTPGGTVEVSAHAFIDCTGDGHLAAMAGCEAQIGDEDGAVQSGTLCFKIANIDFDRYVAYAEETGEGGNMFVACNKAIADGCFPDGETKVSGVAFVAPGVAAFNFGHVYDINPLDAAAMTRAEIEARAKLGELVQFLRSYVPGMENASLVSSGPQIGVRESRRIMGRYVLTKDDYMRRADFDDAIAYYNYPIDIHGAHKGALENKEFNDIYYNRRYQPGEVYGVPLRALQPLGMKNLMTAGRIISSDRYMMASVRVVPCCFATGQAAGTACAMAAKQGIAPVEVDAQQLRERLRADGVWLKDQ